MTERERYQKLMEEPNTFFVFGSNKQGIHGGGAAKAAFDLYGAEWGIGQGPTGRCYAIPTVERIGQPLSLEEIEMHVAEFLDFAQKNPAMKFVLTRVGCVLAGYSDEEIAPMFKDAPDNVVIPEEWLALNVERGQR